MIGWALGKVTGVAEPGRLVLGRAEAAEAAGAWAWDVSSGLGEKMSYKAKRLSTATGRGGGVEMGGGGL